MKIESIKIKVIPDETPDTRHIGEYTQSDDDWNICCYCGEYVHDHTEVCPTRRNRYDFFKPYAGGEKPGDLEDYRKYGKQDFASMEAYNNGDWSYIGIQAEATVSYSIGNGNRRVETLTSGGLWGIESNAGGYLNEVAKDELLDLKGHIAQFGVDISNFDKIAPVPDLA